MNRPNIPPKPTKIPARNATASAAQDPSRRYVPIPTTPGVDRGNRPSLPPPPLKRQDSLTFPVSDISQGGNQITINNINLELFPQENGPEFSELRFILAPCSRLEWKNEHGCGVQGFSAEQVDDKPVLEIDSLATYEWSQSVTTWPFYYLGRQVITATGKCLLDLPSCRKEVTTIEVFIAGRTAAIGKLEFRPTSFSDGKNGVTVTNYVTNETFKISVSSNSNPDYPSMLVKSTTGMSVDLCGFHTDKMRVARRTIRAIKIEFPTVGMASTTKALMMSFGSIWQMNIRYKKKDKKPKYIGILVGLIILSVLIFTLYILS